MDIKRHDRRPAYQQIADDLRDHIANGDYPEGAELPTLAELRTTYEVSEVTARNALALLDRQGVIAVRHGKRAVVLEPDDAPDDSAYAQLRSEITTLNQRMAAILNRLDQMDAITDRLDTLAAAIRTDTRSTGQRARRSSSH